MAVVAVTADNNRIAEAYQTNDTGTWGNDGGGGGVADEPDFYYQGTGAAATAQSRKISTSRIGRSYTHGSGTSMTATDRRHYIAKIQITNKDALLARTAPAVGMKIGSGSGAHYEYYIYGNDNYPKRGGWQIIAISPNVAGYRDATTGSPTLTSVLYWSLLADFSATSKSENVIIDAIDIGAGLHLVGGDGASTDGVFQDFVDADEGTDANSYGYVYTAGGILFCTGRLAIGRNTTPTAVATEFNDSDQTLVWNNGLVETGFHEFLVDLGGTGTTVDLTRISFKSNGEENNTANRGYTTTEDSRTVFTTTGTTGALTMTNCNIDNFASIDLNEKCTLTNCAITNSGPVDATVAGTNGANMVGTSILESAVAADASSLIWNVNADPNGELDDMTFTKGANAHHAVELGTSSPTTVTFTGCTFTGFNASNSQNDSTFYVARTTGDVTINLTDCTGNFTYKSAGANVSVLATVNVDVHIEDEGQTDIEHAQVYISKNPATAYTSGAGNTAGDGDLVLTETIDSDVPQSSWAIVYDASEDLTLPYRFTSHDGANTLTFPTTVSGSTTSAGTATTLISTSTNFLTADIEEGDTIRNTTDGSYAVVDEIVDADNITTSPLKGGSDNTWQSGDGFSVHDLATTLVSGTDTVDIPLALSQTDANGDIPTLGYDASAVPTNVLVRVRYNNGATKYIPRKQNATITSSGLTLNIALTEDTVAT